MDKNDKEEEMKALRDIHKAANELRKFRGLKEIPFIENPEPPLCSFCGLGKNQYTAIVEGPGVYICDECVAMCQEILLSRNNEN